MIALAGDAARTARRAVLGGLFAALCGCSVATPFAVQSSGSGVPAPVAVALSGTPEANSDQARLAQALQRAFAERTIAVSADGALLADYAVSLSDAEGGQTTSLSATDEAAVQWQARPRQSRLFDRCNARRMRATLVLLDRATGELVYRGEGEAVDCDFPDSAFDGVAQALVADAFARAVR